MHNPSRVPRLAHSSIVLHDAYVASLHSGSSLLWLLRDPAELYGVPRTWLVVTVLGAGYAPRRPRDQYLANVALKINAKLGGVNSLISASQDMPFLSRPDAALSWIAANFESKPFMILGADVTHSVVKSENARSIAAVVGSLNKCARPSPVFSVLELLGNLLSCLLGDFRSWFP